MSTPPIIVAHRGASHDAPENTQAAFVLAWMQGANAIEGDFRLTKDHQVVCIHDESTDRTAGRKAAVSLSTLESLRQLDIGGWMGSQWRGQRILTLTEVLMLIPEGKQLFLEIKDGLQILEPIKAVLDQSPANCQRVVLQSFDTAVLKAARPLFPGFQILKLVNRKRSSPQKPWSPSTESIIDEAVSLGLDGINCAASAILHDPQFAPSVHNAGKSLHAWTVNRPGNAAALARLGVNSITTDRPGWLKRGMIDSLAKASSPR